MCSVLSLQEFIDRSNLIHQDKYDYSKSTYVNSTTKTTIICPVHGEFTQLPRNHLTGRGCRKCFFVKNGDTKRSTLTKFVIKAKRKHNNKYSYLNALYVNNKTKISITCPLHGDFEQTPFNHLKYGCDKCARSEQSKRQKIEHDDFLKKVRAKHNDKYMYEKTIYKGAHGIILITCPLHGDFKQSANSHLRGRGCPLCKQGIFHPWFGKSRPTSGYVGKYKNTTFRSLSELFWMLKQESKNEPFLGLDQEENRERWQIPIILPSGKPSTYCPDFFLPRENKVIDIKPRWRWIKEFHKLEQARIAYLAKGIAFELVDVDTISINFKTLSSLISTGQVLFSTTSLTRWKKHPKNRLTD